MKNDSDVSVFVDKNTSTVRQFVQLVSFKDRELCEIINYVVLTNTISIFGVIANVMNIIVFYKQGFSNTINISFFGLAISDLCSLLTLIWTCISFNPLFISNNDYLAPYEAIHLIAGLPHICFSRITCWITVFITAERCLCIIKPLKIKQIITPNVTTITMCSVYAVIIALSLPEYATTYIDWKFYPERNKTMLRLILASSHKYVEGVVFILFSIFGSASFAAVIMFTVILVVQLRQKSKWRKKANADKNSEGSISTKEQKTVTMVIMIASVLIACYTPGVAISVVTFFEPEISIVGLNVNIYFALWSIVFFFDAVNSSINIFLYYNMSTKYRDTFQHIFACNVNNDVHVKG